MVLCLPQSEQRDVCTCNIPGYKMVLVPGSNSRGVEDDIANLQIETSIYIVNLFRNKTINPANSKSNFPDPSDLKV